MTGVKVGNLSPALADELRLDPGAEGVAILEVANGSPAQRFGFRRGDVVVSVNDKPIQKTRDLDRGHASRRAARWRLVTDARRAAARRSKFGG